MGATFKIFLPRWRNTFKLLYCVFAALFIATAQASCTEDKSTIREQGLLTIFDVLYDELSTKKTTPYENLTTEIIDNESSVGGRALNNSRITDEVTSNYHNTETDQSPSSQTVIAITPFWPTPNENSVQFNDDGKQSYQPRQNFRKMYRQNYGNRPQYQQNYNNGFNNSRYQSRPRYQQRSYRHNYPYENTNANNSRYDRPFNGNYTTHYHENYNDYNRYVSPDERYYDPHYAGLDAQRDGQYAYVAPAYAQNYYQPPDQMYAAPYDPQYDQQYYQHYALPQGLPYPLYHNAADDLNFGHYRYLQSSQSPLLSLSALSTASSATSNRTRRRDSRSKKLSTDVSSDRPQLFADEYSNPHQQWIPNEQLQHIPLDVQSSPPQHWIPNGQLTHDQQYAAWYPNNDPCDHAGWQPNNVPINEHWLMQANDPYNQNSYPMYPEQENPNWYPMYDTNYEDELYPDQTTQHQSEQQSQQRGQRKRTRKTSKQTAGEINYNTYAPEEWKERTKVFNYSFHYNTFSDQELRLFQGDDEDHEAYPEYGTSELEESDSNETRDYNTRQSSNASTKLTPEINYNTYLRKEMKLARKSTPAVNYNTHGQKPYIHTDPHSSEEYYEYPTTCNASVKRSHHTPAARHSKYFASAKPFNFDLTFSQPHQRQSNLSHYLDDISLPDISLGTWALHSSPTPSTFSFDHWPSPDYTHTTTPRPDPATPSSEYTRVKHKTKNVKRTRSILSLFHHSSPIKDTHATSIRSTLAAPSSGHVVTHQQPRNRRSRQHNHTYHSHPHTREEAPYSTIRTYEPREFNLTNLGNDPNSNHNHNHYLNHSQHRGSHDTSSNQHLHHHHHYIHHPYPHHHHHHHNHHHDHDLGLYEHHRRPNYHQKHATNHSANHERYVRDTSSDSEADNSSESRSNAVDASNAQDYCAWANHQRYLESIERRAKEDRRNQKHHRPPLFPNLWSMRSIKPEFLQTPYWTGSTSYVWMPGGKKKKVIDLPDESYGVLIEDSEEWWQAQRREAKRLRAIKYLGLNMDGVRRHRQAAEQDAKKSIWNRVVGLVKRVFGRSKNSDDEGNDKANDDRNDGSNRNYHNRYRNYPNRNYNNPNYQYRNNYNQKHNLNNPDQNYNDMQNHRGFNNNNYNNQNTNHNDNQNYRNQNNNNYNSQNSQNNVNTNYYSDNQNQNYRHPNYYSNQNNVDPNNKQRNNYDYNKAEQNNNNQQRSSFNYKPFHYNYNNPTPNKSTYTGNPNSNYRQNEPSANTRITQTGPQSCTRAHETTQ